MIWLLVGYVWLYVHRPFEIWSVLGEIQMERGYMFLMFAAWLVWPGKRFTASNLHLALGLFFLTIVASWLLSPFPAQGHFIIEKFAKVMVFYIILVTSVRDEADLRRFIGATCVVYALYQLHSLREYFGGRYDYAQDVPRMMGVDMTYADPNQFATCILMGLPLVLAMLRTVEGSMRNWLYLHIAFTGACILLTCSRAGIIVYGFFLFLWVCTSKNRTAGFTCLLVVAVLVAAILPGYVFNRIMTLVDSDAGPNVARDSASSRLEGLYRGFELLGKNPLTGVGPGGFAVFTTRGLQAHNLYGQVAGELGLLGIVSFGLFLACLFYNWRQAALLTRDQPWLRETLSYRMMTAVGLCVLMLLLNGMAGHTLFRYNWVWLAGFQVVALNILREQVRASQYAWNPHPYPAPLPQPGWSY